MRRPTTTRSGLPRTFRFLDLARAWGTELRRRLEISLAGWRAGRAIGFIRGMGAGAADLVTMMWAIIFTIAAGGRSGATVDAVTRISMERGRTPEFAAA